MTAKTLDQEAFRSVIGHFATGVTIITAQADGRDYGMTASAVTSLSLEPPMMLVCINRSVPTGQAISSSGRFVVHILREDQGDLAMRFATPQGDKFERLEERRAAGGARVLEGVLAHLECRVVEISSGGTHDVFLSEVEAAESHPGTPLAYYRGKFGRLELDSDESVYVELRERVLSRDIPLGQALGVAELSEMLDAEQSAVFHALIRLGADGLVRREGSVYSITPLSPELVDRAFQMRTVIELGAADVNVGCRSDHELAEFRRRAEVMNPDIVDDESFGPREYFEANARFHEYGIELAGGRELLLAYRRLAIDGILMRSMQDYKKDPEAIGRDLRDHLAIVDSYAAGDEAAAHKAIFAHAERACELVKHEVEQAGGAL